MTTEPAAVPPETRDWTFVITEGCEACGFAPPAPEETGERLRSTIPIWRDALAAATAPERPSPVVWSPLEYACHVRDVCRLARQRLALMLAEDDPVFANWDQDVTAVEDDYFHQAPAVVAAAVTEEVEAAAAAFDAVRPDQWSRPGHRSNGSTFTIATFAVSVLHEAEHHVFDVERP